MLSKPLQVRLDVKDHEQLKEMSEQLDLSVNWLIRKAIKDFLARQSADKNKSRIPS